jgi:hypothetical protein
MQKLPEVPDSEPEKQDSDTSSELYNDHLIAQVKSRLGQDPQVERQVKGVRRND